MRSDRYDNPAADPDVKPFLQSLAKRPGDQLPRLVFADWLEEGGYHNAAAGQRWAAKNGKYPYVSHYNDANGQDAAYEKGRNHGMWRSGWYTHGFGNVINTEPESGEAQTKQHRLPDALWNARGKFGSFFFTDNPGESYSQSNEHWGGPAQRHEAAYLMASHHTKWDDDGEPVSP